MATSAENADQPTSETPHEEQDGEATSNFECNICLDTAKDAVVSYCGHLFCWPCLHTWLETRPNRPACPVCKAGISKDKVVPLYGRGSIENTDPRQKLPPRPQGQRTEPESAGAFQNGINMGFQMSFGIGAFPFTFFNARTFNVGDPLWQAGAPNEEQGAEEAWLSKVFLFVAVFFAMWLLIA